ncbi:MAG: hypothetical protein EXR07_02845 [Acetobacteraceae bacterium]|nr:hypothetical protein [Acetobacteraceae bacterium]
MGAGLALHYLRGKGARFRTLAVLHGLLGASGLCLLVLNLQGPRRGDAMGVGSFGTAAAVLFGAALLFGPFVALVKTRVAGLALAFHVTLAITGFTLFLAWISLG